MQRAAFGPLSFFGAAGAASASRCRCAHAGNGEGHPQRAPFGSERGNQPPRAAVFSAPPKFFITSEIALDSAWKIWASAFDSSIA